MTQDSPGAAGPVPAAATKAAAASLPASASISALPSPDAAEEADGADGADRAAARMRRLRWRARRGLLENDIVLERYFVARPDGLSDDEVRGLDILLDLTDPELLDLILGRAEPEGEAATPAARLVLESLRSS